MQTKHRGITTLAVLLIVLGVELVAAGGYFGWQYYIDKTTPVPAATADETASWQEYKNTDYAYTVKYPQNWYFYKKGFNPPPPTGIFLANVPEGSASAQYSSLTINVDSELNTASLDDYGEVASLVSKGDIKTKATVSGQSAVKLKGVDTIGATNVSYYVIYKTKMYRLGYQFPKTQADQEAICEKIIKTFKFTGTPTVGDMSAGNIQIGNVTVGDLSALQKSVDNGSQPMYLDPTEVSRIEGVKYGFAASDTFKFIDKEYGEAAGTYLATVEATHEGATYTIQLIQPQKQGNAGIWAINSISKK